jgi:hypothetical protein
MADRMKKTLGGHNVFELPPTVGGENFAYFSNEIPGFFFVWVLKNRGRHPAACILRP